VWRIGGVFNIRRKTSASNAESDSLRSFMNWPSRVIVRYPQEFIGRNMVNIACSGAEMWQNCAR
jgi:hypothetical protein